MLPHSRDSISSTPQRRALLTGQLTSHAPTIPTIRPISGLSIANQRARFEATGPCVSTIELFIFLSCGREQPDIFLLAQRAAQFRQGNVL